MFFVVQYKRSARRLVSLDEFDTRREAFEALAALERTCADLDVEQVLLSSDSLATLKRTHGRYFTSADRILSPLG